ncbi:gliding motility-like protein [Sporocytophaga myxococcoides]|uniref:Gliding motility-like protein n=1 Tax=Sporocytophaga myxococcoides TaxID=153721 RepID=A0A098L8H4_9BACT|nr:outer membrane lipoprotein carrier protein LolA [Sporocytophaga myxococcoides]GAL83041.1 gliding motility-like protein [Sporocytophaga myxococcoides]
MKKISLGLLAICLSFRALYAQQDPKAAATLDAVSKKYQQIKSFKAKFTYSLESPTAGINETSEGEIIVQGPKFNLKLSGQEIINNGTTVWTYLKESNEVNITNYEPGEEDVTPSRIYSIYKKGYKYAFLEEKQEGGKVYEVIDLIPEDKNNQFFKVRLEINKKDKTIKSWKIFEKNGNRYLYTVKSFFPDFKVDESLFSFDKSKYKNVEVVDLR